MYIEASAPQKAGDRARLVSQIFPKSSRNRCFFFYYYMYGRNMGTLRVFLSAGGVETLAWQQSGSHPNTWMFARVAIPRSQNVKVNLFYNNILFTK